MNIMNGWWLRQELVPADDKHCEWNHHSPHVRLYGNTLYLSYYTRELTITLILWYLLLISLLTTKKTVFQLNKQQTLHHMCIRINALLMYLETNQHVNLNIIISPNSYCKSCW